MKHPDELRREIEALRNRISKLSAASLRISASLDVNVVLREIVESTRMLTDSRYGLIVAVDDSGQAQDYILAGLEPDERHAIYDEIKGM